MNYPWNGEIEIFIIGGKRYKVWTSHAGHYQFQDGIDFWKDFTPEERLEFYAQTVRVKNCFVVNATGVKP